jgi:hypothetical protein
LSDGDIGPLNGWHALGIDHSEADGPRNNAAKTRGRPFTAGNPGRPKGARSRTTMAAQALLDGEAQALTRLCIDRAFEGDPIALKLCIERILPRRTELPVEFTLPPLQSDSDLTAAMAAILQAASQGKITLGQALEFVRLLEAYGRIASANDPSDLSNLTDEELRSRILQTQARAAAVDIDWVEAAGPQAD